MIQFNLLPDVKLSYIKTRQTKRLVTIISTSSAGFMLLILTLLLVVVYGLQKGHLNNLNNDISKHSKELQATPDLNKILTIQNQLNSLPDLHNKKVVGSRLFEYINQLTPAQASVAKLNIDFTAYTISIIGVADDLSIVNKFADTLKFTNFKISSIGQTGSAFSGVVLTNFSKSEQKFQYQLDAKFDPLIFDNANTVKLTVPNIISTRSETEKPSALFQKLSPQKDQGEQ